MEQFDINIEYERVFGISNYPTLYDAQDEEYKGLRTQIIWTGPVPYLSSKLPFEDIYSMGENSCINKSLDVNITQKLTLNDDLSCYSVVAGIRNHTVDLLLGILSSLGAELLKNNSVEIITHANRHLFWLTMRGRCNAYGYLDKDSKNFYIGTNSLVSIKDDNDYITTSSYRNRHRLIGKYGMLKNNYFRLTKDIKCRSAVAAARYVVGATVGLDLWKDIKGRTLYEVYPEIFF